MQTWATLCAPGCESTERAATSGTYNPLALAQQDSSHG
jgi:hypothetical protein